jgi:hypothetical protein
MYTNNIFHIEGFPEGFIGSLSIHLDMLWVSLPAKSVLNLKEVY